MTQTLIFAVSSGGLGVGVSEADLRVVTGLLKHCSINIQNTDLCHKKDPNQFSHIDSFACSFIFI